MEQFISDDTLQNLLKDSSQRENIVKLLKRQSKTMPNGGDYYFSATWRETAIVCNENGHTWNKRVIMKSVPNSELSKRYVEESGIFKTEITMYLDILPLMEKQINNYEIASNTLWPKCIAIHDDNLIILEDLIPRGFRKIDRQEGLDYEHSLLVFRGIAKLHVLSIQIKEKLETNNMLRDFYFAKPSRLNIFKKKINELTENMFAKWESKWHKLAANLRNNCEELFLRFIEKTKKNENNFNVLNHGDLRTSNILFQHCEFTDKLIGVRFIDYQLCHYNSFAMDLQYILHTSVQSDVRKYHTNDLLMSYHEILLLTAKKIGLTNQVIPSLCNIKKQMSDKLYIGILIALQLLDVMVVEPNDAENLETMLSNGFEKLIKKVMTSDVFKDKMQAILEPYIDSDLRNI